MNFKKSNFLFLAGLIILTRLMDGVTTYIASPDLALELNPLVSKLNFGWLGLGLVTGSIAVVSLVFLYIGISYEIKYNLLHDKQIGSFKRFIIYITYGPSGKAVDFLYRMPPRKLLIKYIGFVLTYGLIYVGLISSINNIFVFKYDSFSQSARTAINFIPHFIMYSAIIVLLVLSYFFYRNEYGKFLRAVPENGAITSKQ